MHVYVVLVRFFGETRLESAWSSFTSALDRSKALVLDESVDSNYVQVTRTTLDPGPNGRSTLAARVFRTFEDDVDPPLEVELFRGAPESATV